MLVLATPFIWVPEYESTMMAEAGELIAEAHAAGLIVVLWIYPRGKAVTDEKDPDLIAGAAGVALCLGADFVKVNPPHDVEGQTSAGSLKIASMAAGRTGLVCAGGSKADANVFLTQLHDQIHIGGACGNATGRNHISLFRRRSNSSLQCNFCYYRATGALKTQKLYSVEKRNSACRVAS